MLHGLPSEAPWNRKHESIPTYKCATPECVAYAHDEDEHHQCDFCGSRHCADCLVKIEDLKVCPACRACGECGDEAFVQCGVCSGLVCIDHAFMHGGRVASCAKCVPKVASATVATKCEKCAGTGQTCCSCQKDSRACECGFIERVLTYCRPCEGRGVVLARKPAASVEMESDLERARR